MKFTVEITGKSGEGPPEVIHRATVNVISPKGAMTAARSLLSRLKNKGANGASVFNRAGETIYDWKE